MRQLLIAAASAALLAGCSETMATDAEMGAAPAMAGDMTPEDRTAYVTMAAASDLFEIQSSQMAVAKAQRSEVREFAQMLVTHHTQTSQQLMAAAQASGITPPAPTLMPMQAEMMRQLQAAGAGEFDRVYVSQQVPAHEMALALHGNYASDGDTAALRTVAAAARPIVQQHLTRARQLD